MTRKAEMSDEYARGQRDGLRLALAVLAAEEEKWAALLGESAAWRTNLTREVRHKSLQVAQKRVRTVLNRLASRAPTSIDAEIAAALEKAGL
jgi:flagellar biosynthesis/type III secretory pathway protein FliH